MIAHTWKEPLPEMVTIDLNCPFPRWTCSVHACDGRAVARFETIAQMDAWLKKHRYTVPAKCPKPRKER